MERYRLINLLVPLALHAFLASWAGQTEAPLTYPKF